MWPSAEKSRFNPEMLIRARDAAGMTQTDLAKSLGCSQGNISKIESGLRQPEEEFLSKAADVLGVRPSLFSRWPAHCALPITFHRKKVRLSVGALRRIHGQVALRRVALEALTRSADVPQNMLPSVSLKEKGMSPERVAQEVRIRWMCPQGPIGNLVELLESKGVVVFPEDFGTDLISGLSVHEPSDGLPPTVFVNTCTSADRQRFTLAHELAHLVLHHHLPLPPENCEEEADRFAAEFLMPARDVVGFLSRLKLEDAAALKRTWRVSMSSIIKRAATLKQISTGRARSLWIEMGRRGWRSFEPVQIEGETPTLYRELAEVHLSDLGFTEEQLSVALDMTPERLRAGFLGRRTAGVLRLVQ